MKSTIEIKTAFEGCAEVCELFQLDNNDKECMYLRFCEDVKKTIAKLPEQTTDNPLDDLFADSMEKLDGLNVGESEECIIKVRCKDCKHKYVTGTTTQYYVCDFMDAQFEENGYCHHGERIDNE